MLYQQYFRYSKADSSQIHVSWTILFNQYLTRPLSWHWWTSRTAIPIIPSAKAESDYYQFYRLWSVVARDRTHDLPFTRRMLWSLGHRGSLTDDWLNGILCSVQWCFSHAGAKSCTFMYALGFNGIGPRLPSVLLKDTPMKHQWG